MSIIAQSITWGDIPIETSTWISSSNTTATIYPDYQPKPQKWTCKFCLCRNKPDDDNCPHCGAPAGDVND